MPGNPGEFTVHYDGRVIAQKQGREWPDPDQVVAAIERLGGGQ